jgi:hypothetical protein
VPIEQEQIELSQTEKVKNENRVSDAMMMREARGGGEIIHKINTLGSQALNCWVSKKC